MTITEMIDLASATLTADTVDERAAQGLALARGFMDRLGEDLPCGWGFEQPEVCREEDMDCKPKVDGENIIKIDQRWVRWVSAADADHMARLLLAAADAAEDEESL